MKLSYHARTVLLVACAVACGLYLAREPFQVWKQQRARADQAEASARQDRKTATELKQQEALLSSPMGREENARKLGFRRKNETPYQGQP